MSDVIRKVVTRQGTPEAETWWKRTTDNQSPKPLDFSLVQENVFSSEVEWRVRRMVYTIQRNTVSSTVARYHQRNGKQKDGCDLWDMHRTLRAKHDVCALSVSLSVHTTVSMCVCVCSDDKMSNNYITAVPWLDSSELEGRGKVRLATSSVQLRQLCTFSML